MAAGGTPARAPWDDPGLAGLEEAAGRFGLPERRVLAEPLLLDPGGKRGFGRRRVAEVVMILPRPGGVLVHTKDFYPGGVLRLPTGGVRRGEPILDAAARELEEETGLILAPTRFVFHLIQHLDHDDGARPFHSLGILFPWSEAPVAPLDPEEAISLLRPVPWDGLQAIAEDLEGLGGAWHAWGVFRAAPHRLLLEARRRRPEWFEES